MKRNSAIVRAVALAVLGTFVSEARAWDNPGHIVTAAIAFAEIERAQPELIEKIGLLFLKHPDPAPFWVVAREAEGRERIRRMFLEYSRWPDDSKLAPNDRLTWPTAHWAVVAKEVPPVAKVAARHGKPAGQTLITDKEESL